MYLTPIRGVFALIKYLVLKVKDYVQESPPFGECLVGSVCVYKGSYKRTSG